MSFPVHRTRRLRRTPALRDLARETRLSPADFVDPLFIAGDGNVREPLTSIPGVDLLAGKPLAEEARAIADLGIPAVLLFPVVDPSRRDEQATLAWSSDAPVQRAIEQIRQAAPGLVVIADLCLCEYDSQGHCGLLTEGEIDNDRTIEALGRAAVSLAHAGADFVAPAGVMDGSVRAIRSALDAAGHQQVATMPYSAKFHSLLYGPFKQATASAPAESLHATHQLDPANVEQALARMALDVAEGADMMIVKPALYFLDVVAKAHERFDIPVAAYNVSGEYNMLRAAGDDRLMLEALLSIKRAGADSIITYFAKQAARMV